MSDTPAGTELLRALGEVLGTLGARWYVFGAQAVLVWGRPRLTGDVDVTMFLDPEDPDPFVTAMAQAGFDLRVTNVSDFVARTRVFRSPMPQAGSRSTSSWGALGSRKNSSGRHASWTSVA